MRELSIPTRKTNQIHNDVSENTIFLLLDQPSREANTTGTLISKIDEVAINAKKSLNALVATEEGEHKSEAEIARLEAE